MKKVGKQSENFSKKFKFEKYTIEHDNFDIRNFNRIRRSNQKLSKTYIEGRETYPQFDELQQDVFDSLYKYNPELVDDSKIDMPYKLNSQVMQAVLESPKYKELRLMTKMDLVNATVGTEVLGEQVKELVQELQEQFKEALEKAQQAQQAVQDAEESDDQEDGQGSAGDSEGDSDESEEAGNGQGQQKVSLEEAKRQLEEAMKEVGEQIQKKEAKRINRMLDQTLTQTRETNDTITNWGLDQNSDYERLGHQEKVKLLNQLRGSQKLRDLAELAGRYRRMALTIRREKIKKGTEELFDTTYGDEIGKILPTEMLRMLEPELDNLFKKDLLERQLLQYEYSGNEKKCKGPIICCIDGSGSMHGSREIWAKAVALGILEIAKGQNRSFMAVHFDATRDKNSLHVNRFDKGTEFQTANIIDMAEFFPGGGTLFEPPLDKARELISEDSGFSQADIIFITDGESAVRNEWLENFLEWKEKETINIYSVLIDNYFNSDASLKEFSNKITK